MTTLAAASGVWSASESGILESGARLLAATGGPKDGAEETPAWAWVATWALTNVGAWMVAYAVGCLVT